MPAPARNCLEQLVGLAPQPLPCFPFPEDPDGTDWITASSRADSAGGPVYLSQLVGLSFQPAKSDPATDLYTRAADARRAAATYVRQAIQQAPKVGAEAARFTRAGLLGKAGNGSAYAGGAALALTTGYAEGGSYQVSALGLSVTVATANVPVLLDGQPVATVTANGQLQPLSVPFAIPFDGQQHVLTAALPGGVQPLVGQVYCFCGGGDFTASVRERLPAVTAATSNAGFFLQVKEVCATAQADALCYAATPGVNDELADTLAQAVLAMSGYYYLFGLSGLTNYSRYTLLDTKQMSAAGAMFKANADQNIAWLAQPQGLRRLPNPCFTCAPNPYGPRIVKTV